MKETELSDAAIAAICEATGLEESEFREALAELGDKLPECEVEEILMQAALRVTSREEMSHFLNRIVSGSVATVIYLMEHDTRAALAELTRQAEILAKVTDALLQTDEEPNWMQLAIMAAHTFDKRMTLAGELN